MFKTIKSANIELQYLQSIGFDTSKKNGKCPIHNGSNSHGFSYKVENNEYIFNCWTKGCVKSVDIIELCRVKEGFADVVEACKYLAGMFGIELPNSSPKAKYKAQERILIKTFKEEKLELLDKQINKYLDKQNLEKAYELENKKDNIKDMTEKINYSQYRATSKHTVSKYINEEIEGIRGAINSAKAGKKVLLIAPTGSGKTYTIIEELKKEKTKSLFIVPNSANVEQIMEEYKIPGAWGDIESDKAIEAGCVSSYTWDKFGGITSELTDHVAVLDEVHQTLIDMYRKDKIERVYDKLETCIGQIHITATPSKLDFSVYDEIVEYSQKQQTNYNIRLYSKVDNNIILNIVNNSKKSAVFRNNKKELLALQMVTKNKKCGLVCGDNKLDNEVYNNIIFRSTLGDIDVLLNTSTIVAGVNIYDKNITDIIIVGERDVATVKQYIARFRDLDSVNVHIFNNFSDYSDLHSIEYLLKYSTDQLEKFVDYANASRKLELVQLGIGIRAFRLEESNCVFFSKEKDEYIADRIGARNAAYTNYYNRVDIVSYKYLLGEYFQNIKMIDIEAEKNEDIEAAKEAIAIQYDAALDTINNNLDICVYATDILSDKLSGDAKKYLKRHNLSADIIKKKLLDAGIDDIISIPKVGATIDLYSKYTSVNKFPNALAFELSRLPNRKRGLFYEQLNLIVYKMIDDSNPELLDNTMLENRIYNLIKKIFKIGISYTSDDLKYFLEVLKIMIPGHKMSETKLGTIIKQIYNVEDNRTRNFEKFNFAYNQAPENENNKLIKIYTITEYKTSKGLINDFEIKDIDPQIIDKLINNRYDNVINSVEAVEIIQARNFFIS